jgi:hypothetical protein
MSKEKSQHSCVYCEYPDRYNLTAVTVTAKPGFNGFLYEGEVQWHVETVQYLSGIPKKRIRCQRQ